MDAWYKSYIKRVRSHTPQEIFNEIQDTLNRRYNFEPTLIEQVMLRQYSI